MVRTRSEARPAPTEPSASDAALLPVSGCSFMIKSRMVKQYRFAELERASENNTQIDYLPADDCTIFIMPLQLPNEGSSMHELRQLLHDEAACLDKREQERLWSLRVDAATILTKLIQLRFRVVSCCVSTDDVYTWTLIADEVEVKKHAPDGNFVEEEEITVEHEDRKSSLVSQQKNLRAEKINSSVSRDAANVNGSAAIRGFGNGKTSSKRSQVQFEDEQNEHATSDAADAADDDDDDACNDNLDQSDEATRMLLRCKTAFLPKILDSLTLAPLRQVKLDESFIHIGESKTLQRRVSIKTLQLLKCQTLLTANKKAEPNFSLFVQRLLQTALSVEEDQNAASRLLYKTLPTAFQCGVYELVRTCWAELVHLSTTLPSRRAMKTNGTWTAQPYPPNDWQCREWMAKYFASNAAKQKLSSGAKQKRALTVEDIFDTRKDVEQDVEPEYDEEGADPEEAENDGDNNNDATEFDDVDDLNVKQDLDGKSATGDENRSRIEDEADCEYVRREGGSLFLGTPPFQRRITDLTLKLLERNYILSAKLRNPRYKFFVRQLLQDTIGNDEAVLLTTKSEQIIKTMPNAPENMHTLATPFALAIVELVGLAWKRRSRLATTSPQRRRLVEQNKCHVEGLPPQQEMVYFFIDAYFQELRDRRNIPKQQQPFINKQLQQKFDAESRKAGDRLYEDKIFNPSSTFGRMMTESNEIISQMTTAELLEKCQELYTSLYNLTDLSNTDSTYDDVKTELRNVRLHENYLYLGEQPFEFRISVVKFHKLKQHSLLDSKKPIFSLFTTRLLRGTVPSKVSLNYTTTKSQFQPDLKLLPDTYVDAIEDIVRAAWYEMHEIVRPMRVDNQLLDPSNIWCQTLDTEQPQPPTRDCLRKWLYTCLGNVRLKQKQLEDEAKFGGPKRNRLRRTLVEILPSDEEAEEISRSIGGVEYRKGDEGGDSDDAIPIKNAKKQKLAKKTPQSNKNLSSRQRRQHREMEVDDEMFNDSGDDDGNDAENSNEQNDEDEDEVDVDEDFGSEGRKKTTKSSAQKRAVGRRRALFGFGSDKKKSGRLDEASEAVGDSIAYVRTSHGRVPVQVVEDDADYESNDLRVVLAGPQALEPFGAEGKRGQIPPLPHPKHIELKDGYMYLGEAPRRRRLSLAKYRLIKLTVLLNANKMPKFSIFIRRLAFATIPQSESVFYAPNPKNNQRIVPLMPLPPAYLEALKELIYSAWHSTRRLYIQRTRRMMSSQNSQERAGEVWKISDKAVTSKEFFSTMSTYFNDVRDDVLAMQQKNWKRKRRPLQWLEIMPSDDEEKFLSREPESEHQGGGMALAPAAAAAKPRKSAIKTSPAAPRSAPIYAHDQEENEDDVNDEEEKMFAQVHVDADEVDDEDLQVFDSGGKRRGGDDDDDSDGSLKEFVRGRKSREVLGSKILSSKKK